jgi:hypothetical protein
MQALEEILCILKDMNSKCPVKVITSAGTGNVPAGFKSVAIVKTSPDTDTVTVTLSDGTTYIMTEKGETITDAADEGTKLPAYGFSGAGTVKWHGIK